MSYAVIFRCLGLLLLTAAGLKAYGVAADPVARSGVFSSPAVQFAIIAFEFVLGGWLLSGANPIGGWFAALAAFVTFACASFYLGWIGASSCGCAGKLFFINPWYAFTADVLIVAGLAIWRPNLESLRKEPRQQFFAAAFPGVIAIVVITGITGALVGVAHAGFGSVPAAVAYFRGEQVSIEPRVVNIGSAETGEQRTVEVEVANWTDHPVRLIGGTSDCSCTVLGDLPVTIAAGQSRLISVGLSVSGRPGVFNRKASFLVDNQGFQRLDFQLTGRIVNPSE